MIDHILSILNYDFNVCIPTILFNQKNLTNIKIANPTLTFEEEILEAEVNGELTIQKTDNVVNAPMIVWKSYSMEQRFCDTKSV